MRNLNLNITPADATQVKSPLLNPAVDSPFLDSIAKIKRPEVIDEYLASPKIKIKDTRITDAASGFKLSDTNKLHAEEVPTLLIQKIAKAAKDAGIDPYTALAIAHQESRLGSGKDEGSGELTITNPMRVRYDTAQITGGNYDSPFALEMNIINDKLRLAKRLGKKDEASILQAYNGYGKVGKHTEGKQQMMYGIDVSKEPIDMNKNPVYGKRVIDIRDNILKKNPEIVKLINSVK